MRSLLCQLRGGHRMTRSILNWEPSPTKSDHALVTWHYNCLRCPHTYKATSHVPFVSRRYREEAS